jgi:hypothetical protein
MRVTLHSRRITFLPPAAGKEYSVRSEVPKRGKLMRRPSNQRSHFNCFQPASRAFRVRPQSPYPMNNRRARGTLHVRRYRPRAGMNASQNCPQSSASALCSTPRRESSCRSCRRARPEAARCGTHSRAALPSPPRAQTRSPVAPHSSNTDSGSGAAKSEASDRPGQSRQPVG